MLIIIAITNYIVMRTWFIILNFVIYTKIITNINRLKGDIQSLIVLTDEINKSVII